MAKKNTAKRKGLDFADKNRITAMLKSVPIKTKDINNLGSYLNLVDFLNERDHDKYNYDDVLNFITSQTIKCLTTQYSKSTFPKFLYSIIAFMNIHIDQQEISIEEYEILINNNNDITELNNEKKDKTEEINGKKYLIKIHPLDTQLYLEIKKIKQLYETFKKDNPSFFEKEEELEIIDELIRQIEDLVEKISPDIKNKFEKKANSTESSIDMLQELNDEIKKLKDIISNLEKENESLSSKNNKLDKLNNKQLSEISELKKKLTELEQKYNNLQKKADKQDDYDSLLKDIEKLNKEIEQLEKENQELCDLKKKYETLQSSYQSLADKLKKLEQTHDELQKSYVKVKKHRDNLSNSTRDFKSLRSELSTLKKKCGDLQNEVNKLTKKNKELTQQLETQSIITAEEVINKHIQRIIIEKLYKETCSIDELIKILSTSGYNLSMEELYFHIAKIKKEIRIFTAGYDDNIPSIGIDLRAKINGSLSINLPCNNTSRILIISNTLLNRDTNELLNIIEDIYDYCIKNSIHYIFNIGNLFNVNVTDLLSVSELRNIQKQLEAIIKNHPLDISINNILLGSTSDLNITRYGIDPIDFLAQERLDFHYLGYKTGKIDLNNSDNKLFISEPIIECSETNQREKIIEYLAKAKSIYDLNIFGSNYDCLIDTINNFITVPPLYNSELLNGATQLDITFNASGDIEEILCTPLIIDDILIPTSHVYIKK